MAVDIVGPANAPNSVTARPADTRTFGASDTFFKDCTSALSNDGTKIQAGWLNAVLSQFRNAIRGNGLNIGGSAPIVAEDNSDNMLLNAMKQLIQRGQPLYCVDSGAANALVVAPSPAVVEYKAGLKLLVKINAASTGGATINVSGLGVKNIVHLDGSVILPNDFTAGMLAELGFDGTNFQTINLYNIGRPRLYAARDYWVDAAIGSDANDGLSAGAGHAFATIQHALDVQSTFDNNGFNVTIHVANGTYAPVNCPRVTGSGTIFIVGNITVPSACIVSGVANCFYLLNVGGSYDISGFKVVSSAGGGVVADGSGSNVNLASMDYGACAASGHIVAQRGANVICLGVAQRAGSFTNISGSSPRHWYALSGGLIDAYAQPYTLTGAVTLSSAFAHAARGGTMSVGGLTFTNPGNATGTKFQLNTNGVIDTSGASASYLPGTIAGIGAGQTGGGYA